MVGFTNTCLFTDPDLYFRRRAAKNVQVGDLVDVMCMYRWGQQLASPVVRIIHHRKGMWRGHISIVVADSPDHPMHPRTLTERTLTLGPRKMVHIWEKRNG